MKKLMIAMTAVALAVSAQATLVSQIKTAAPGATALSSTTISGYSCFVLSGTKMATAMGVKSIGATEVDRVAEWLGANFAVNYQKVKDTKPTSMLSSWTSSALDFRNTDSSLSYANRFGIVTWENADEEIAAFRVFNFNNNQNINDWAGTTAAGEWTDWSGVAPIPEPTSGLLLLLGVAGLALKRKQK